MLSTLFWILFIISSLQCEIISELVKSYNPSSYCNVTNATYTFHDHTRFTYRIKEGNLCSGSVYLLNYVQSASSHFERRMIIRETFGSLKFIDGDSVKLLFVLGLPNNIQTQKLIDNESDNFRDIVQANFLDTYHNLTLKHIVALHWIHSFCPQAQFISKSDDDTFVNNFWLRIYLKDKFVPRDKFILGQVSYDETPIRMPYYKWTVSRDMYEDEVYPAFIKGYGYVMSQGAIEPLLVCSFYHKYLFIDDIFVSGIARTSANVRLENTYSIHQFTYFVNNSVDATVLDKIFIIGNNVQYVSRWKEAWKMVLLWIS